MSGENLLTWVLAYSLILQGDMSQTFLQKWLTLLTVQRSYENCGVYVTVKDFKCGNKHKNVHARLSGHVCFFHISPLDTWISRWLLFLSLLPKYITHFCNLDRLYATSLEFYSGSPIYSNLKNNMQQFNIKNQ